MVFLFDMYIWCDCYIHISILLVPVASYLSENLYSLFLCQRSIFLKQRYYIFSIVQWILHLRKGGINIIALLKMSEYHVVTLKEILTQPQPFLRLVEKLKQTFIYVYFNGLFLIFLLYLI